LSFIQNKVPEYKKISREEEYEMFRKLALSGDNDNKTIQHIAEKYKDLVSVIAESQKQKLYLQTSADKNELLDELIQNGSEALLDAIGKFDPERGVRFVTFAAKLINFKMVEESNNENKIEIPSNKRKKIKKLALAKNELNNFLNRKPTIPELATHLNWSHDEVKKIDILNSLQNIDSLNRSEPGDDMVSELQDNIKSYDYEKENKLKLDLQMLLEAGISRKVNLSENEIKLLKKLYLSDIYNGKESSLLRNVGEKDSFEGLNKHDFQLLKEGLHSKLLSWMDYDYRVEINTNTYKTVVRKISIYLFNKLSELQIKKLLNHFSIILCSHSANNSLKNTEKKELYSIAKFVYDTIKELNTDISVGMIKHNLKYFLMLDVIHELEKMVQRREFKSIIIHYYWHYILTNKVYSVYQINENDFISMYETYMNTTLPTMLMSEESKTIGLTKNSLNTYFIANYLVNTKQNSEKSIDKWFGINKKKVNDRLNELYRITENTNKKRLIEFKYYCDTTINNYTIHKDQLFDVASEKRYQVVDTLDAKGVQARQLMQACTRLRKLVVEEVLQGEVDLTDNALTLFTESEIDTDSSNIYIEKVLLSEKKNLKKIFNVLLNRTGGLNLFQFYRGFQPFIETNTDFPYSYTLNLERKKQNE
jgi:DNA-directed RNA polymerase specialized sigma subunit